jgi:DNA polymerase-4
VPEHREHSIGAETTFGTDQDDTVAVSRRVLELSDRVAARMRHQGVMARTVSVKVRSSDFATFTRSRTLDGPTDVAREIYLVARELVAGVDLGGLPVRLVGVRGENLQQRDGSVQQPTLEESVDPRSGAQREAELALDAVREKFGKTAIDLGVHHKNGTHRD